MIGIGFLRAHLSSAAPSAGRATVYVLLLVTVPTILRLLIDPFAPGLPFVTYFPFVLVAALLLDWRQAMAATVLSTAVANYLFMEPRFTFFAGRSDTIGSVFFFVSASMIVAVGLSLRRAVRELEQSRAREDYLRTELQHRIKNSLAVVQGLATQTFRDVPGAGASLEKLHGRIRALAEANDILRHGRWEECSLPDLAVRALEPFNSKGALNLVGPACSLPECSCVPLVLALHELATNAVKYGALSSDHGQVELSWKLISSADGDADLYLDWQESGGPAVAAPTSRGLGGRLLRPQPGLKDVKQIFESDGVACSILIHGARELGPGNRRRPLPPVTLYLDESPTPAT